MSPRHWPIGLALLLASCLLEAQEATHDHAVPAADVATPATAELAIPKVAPDASQREHVAPPPPATMPTAASHKDMARTMGMDDSASYSLVRFDRLEHQEGDAIAWDADAWYGGDYHRLWLKFEGERENDDWDGRVESLWSRVFSRWWSAQVGVRQDFGDGAQRTWLAAGVEGLAPYYFDVEATAYVSDQGRLAARFAVTYDLLLTQRLILQPDLELTAFSKADPALRRGSGLSGIELGLRLRYEIRREVAPYAGIEWTRSFGQTSDILRRNGESAGDLHWVAGVRFWF